MNFQIGGVSIPILAGLAFTQTYECIGGSVLHRMQSGRAHKQMHFSKLKTTLSGQGWIPAGLDGLNYHEVLLLKCAVPKSISSDSPKIVLPCNRRKDDGFEPRAYALVAGHMIETSINLKQDIGILEPVRFALSYQVYYYPEIFVFAEAPQIQGNITGVEFAWTLSCEEV